MQDKQVDVTTHLRGTSIVRQHRRALGIPDRSVKTDPTTEGIPETWEFGVHEHHAERAGLHFDLRLGDRKSGIAHSWAVPKAKLPQPGEKLLAVQQPDHTLHYMDFRGVIREGYGAGKVNLHARSTTEVVAANEKYIRFNLYEGAQVHEFLLRRTDGDNWLFMNVTPQPDKLSWVPRGKASYRSLDPDLVKFDNPGEVLQAKIDGAHVLVVLDPGKQIRVLSHRLSRKDGGFIDHTFKLKDLVGRKAPDDIGRIVLRAELWASDKDGKAVPTNKLAGILNSNVWKARTTLDKEEYKLRLAAFDVAVENGRNVGEAPFIEKFDTINRLVSRFDFLEVPPTATTEAGKKALFESIKKGTRPETAEGVVVHNMHGTVAQKAKFRDDHDVYIRGVFPAYGADGSELKRAGGFLWSWEPTGPIQGKVGTGFSHSMLEDMSKNPDRYVGRVARLKAQERYSSGALRAPSFLGWHLDK